MRKFLKIFWLIGTVFIVSFLPGCGQEESDLGNEALVRVGDRTMTVLDFNTAFEFAKTALDHNARQQSEDLRKAKLRLLNQLTIEMVLLERAEDLGISITDAELEKAVAEIKSDYPEGEFEETLLDFFNWHTIGLTHVTAITVDDFQPILWNRRRTMHDQMGIRNTGVDFLDALDGEDVACRWTGELVSTVAGANRDRPTRGCVRSELRTSGAAEAPGRSRSYRPRPSAAAVR